MDFAQGDDSRPMAVESILSIKVAHLSFTPLFLFISVFVLVRSCLLIRICYCFLCLKAPIKLTRNTNVMCSCWTCLLFPLPNASQFSIHRMCLQHHQSLDGPKPLWRHVTTFGSPTPHLSSPTRWLLSQLNFTGSCLLVRVSLLLACNFSPHQSWQR